MKNWLQKHRLVNEVGKLVTVGILSLFGFHVWEAGKLASLEIAQVDAYKLMIFGFLTGAFGITALSMFIDALFSLLLLLKGKLHKGSSSADESLGKDV